RPVLVHGQRVAELREGRAIGAVGEACRAAPVVGAHVGEHAQPNLAAGDALARDLRTRAARVPVRVEVDATRHHHARRTVRTLLHADPGGLVTEGGEPSYVAVRHLAVVELDRRGGSG